MPLRLRWYRFSDLGGMAVRGQTTRRSRIATWILVSLCPAGSVFGELRPAECALIYNQDSVTSRELAQYYAARRKIPMDRLLGIALPVAETLSREQYEARVPPVVRAFLSDHEWGERVRCLVTCYDVPLRIGACHATGEQRARADTLEQRLADIFRRLRALIDEIRRTDQPDSGEVGHPAPPNSPANTAAYDRAALEKLSELYLAEMRDLADRQRGLLGAAMTNARRRTFNFAHRAEGLTGLIRRAPQEGVNASPNTAIRLRTIRNRAADARTRIEKLFAYGSSASEFDRGVKALPELEGLFGVAAVLQKRIASLRGEDSESSFDSELSLVLWESYDPSGWQPNELHFDHHQEPAADNRRRTLMVSRLDAPSPDIVRRMIDEAIAAELQGLKGTFYIDARGLEKDDGLLAYDRDLYELARIVRTQTSMPAVLDDRPSVFAPGACPNAALYCGWYSLSKYVDAFEFVPGAVAAHIASFELVSLRRGPKRYWCKELLADGAAATFGATSEPYLESFPKPTPFFTRLLSGRYALVEVFYATKPFNSWRLSLLGDPLYNPFKNSPHRIRSAATNGPTRP